MPDSFIPYGGDPPVVGRRSATVKRTETRDGITADFHRDEVIVVERKVVNYVGWGATFRIAGVTTTPQNLWSIENGLGSGVIVALKELRLWSISTAANTALVTPALFRITTLPTGGTTFIKTPLDSRLTNTATGVVLRGGASADGTASVITATAAGQRLASGFNTNTVGTAYAMPPEPNNIIRQEHTPPLLHPGQAYLLQNITASLATNHYVVECTWEEITEY